MLTEDNIFKINLDNHDEDDLLKNKSETNIKPNEEGATKHSAEWWKKQDQASEGADSFYKLIKDKNLNTIWDENYKHNPLSFFEDENFEYLNQLEVGERLNLLAMSATSLLITPQSAEKYFERFPDDLLAVDSIFSFVRFEDINYRNYHLFSICALQMDPGDLRVSNNGSYQQLEGKLEQFYNIALRRREAPKFLLSNFNNLDIKDNFAEFGKAASGLFEVLNKADDQNTRLDTSPMFSNEYQKLSEDKKSLFLRKCLAQLQYSLLFTETFNSRFTAESTAYYDAHIEDHYNVAHSMIFKTYQPRSSYNIDQSYFRHEMDWTVETGGDVEEYADHKMLLAVLEEFQDLKADQDENTELLVEFWNKNRNPIFINSVSRALSKQNVNLAASRLLENLQSEKDKKEPISAMLYRLEFGKVGISEDGIKYLEKIYDLGQYNKSEFCASRLTANGEIGIFNEELELIKYFHLGQLDSPEKRMKAEVLDFTYDTLFIGDKNETKEERQEREIYLEEFKKNYYRISEEEIFKNTDTRLNNLSFKEQGWFLIYFNQVSQKDKEQLRNFIATYRENGVKSFLSLEANQKLGNKIVELGNKLDRDSGQIIFHKISEIIDLAEKENQELEQLFLTDQIDIDFDWKDIRLSLLNKTQNIIVDFNKSFKGKNETKQISKLLSDLEKSQADMLLLTQVLKATKKEREKIPLEIIRDLTLEKKVIDNHHRKVLTVTEKKQLVKIAEENYQNLFLQKNKNYNPEAYHRIISNFKKELENIDGQMIYILKYKGNIICFSKFKKISAEAVAGGSFNVSQDVQGLALGGAFLNKVLSEISKYYDVHIVSRKDNLANNYYQRSGFIITEEYREKDGVDYYRMLKPSDSARLLKKAS